MQHRFGESRIRKPLEAIKRDSSIHVEVQKSQVQLSSVGGAPVVPFEFSASSKLAVGSWLP